MTDDEYNAAIEWHMVRTPVYRSLSAVIDAMDAEGYPADYCGRAMIEGMMHGIIEPE